MSVQEYVSGQGCVNVWCLQVSEVCACASMQGLVTGPQPLSPLYACGGGDGGWGPMTMQGGYERECVYIR